MIAVTRRFGGFTGSQGFSLLEVLIAMFVLSVGAASVISLFAAGSSTHRRSVDRTRAALVAEQVIAEAAIAYVPGRTAAEIPGVVQGRLPAVIDGYRFDLTVAHPQGKEWQPSELVVHVAVRWQESGQARAETFTTILLPRAPAIR